jgi:hypothetical protein
MMTEPGVLPSKEEPRWEEEGLIRSSYVGFLYLG